MSLDSARPSGPNTMSDATNVAELLQTRRERFVYLVQTDEEYDRPHVVEAYLSELQALARVEQLNALAESAPLPPALDDSDEAWDQFRIAAAAWNTSHPLGPEPPGYLNSCYAVAKVRLAGEEA